MITLGGMAGLGSLVGTIGNDSLLRSINDELHNSDFFNSVGDMLSKGREMFVNNIVRPIQLIGDAVKNIVGRFEVDERFVAVTSEDLLRKVPTCMQECFLQYAPIRKLFDEGRIFGFGWTAVPEGDAYGRLINNGTVNNVLEAMDENDEVDFEWTFKSTDPNLSYEELEDIEETRRYIEKLLAETEIDPTDPFLNDRG